MSISSKIILSLALAFILINVSLALMGQNEIAVYFIFNSIAFFTIALAYSAASPRPRAALQYMGSLVFAGFLFFVVVKIMEIMQ